MWLTTVSEDIKAIEELERSSDRSAGVIVGAIIEARLADVLRRDLHGKDERYSKRVSKEIFRPEGPLGSFGSKIGISYLLGYFTETAHADLQNLKKIRNLFAHYREHDDFEVEQIKGLCANFKLVEKRVRQSENSIRADDGPEVFTDGVQRYDNYFWLALADPGQAKKTAKGRFINTAKLFCAAFEMSGPGRWNFKEEEWLKKPYL